MTWANAGWCLARCVAGMAGMGWKMAIGFTCSGCRGRIKVICHRWFSLDQQIVISLVIYVWLVVWNMAWSWLSIYWESYSHLTNIFQRGWNHEPDVIAWHHVLCNIYNIIYIYIYIYRWVYYMATKSSHRAIGVSVCGDCWAEGCPIPVLALCVAATPSWATSMARESVTGHVTCESDGEVLMIYNIYIYISHIIIIIYIYIYIYICIHWKRCFHYYTDWGRN